VRQNLKKSIRPRIGGNQPFQGQNLKKSIREKKRRKINDE
jgi:hypothetical protein